jgi:hypothetical protein
MIDRLLCVLGEKFPLTERPCGEFSKLKVRGMRFEIGAYYAKGLGHVSVMRASGFFGLMRMETLMITPTELDLPIYSYDRIHAMGNDTLIVELYDTLVNAVDASLLCEVKSKYAYVTERDPGEHWYDEIKLKESISKKGKKKDSSSLDELACEYFHAFTHLPVGEIADFATKRRKTEYYVNGLIERGGPSTDVFKKSLGKQKTEELFKKVLFGIDK